MELAQSPVQDISETLMLRDQRNTQAADIQTTVAFLHCVRTLLTCANFRLLSSPLNHSSLVIDRFLDSGA
jgi:hypothetical protein